MIKYHTDGGVLSFFQQIIQRAGSVFPSASKVAIPCSMLTAALTICIKLGLLKALESEDSVLRDNAAWGGFSFLVGFLIVFRTSQSYNRFWDGCTSTHHMRAEWFDGCSSLLAFTRHSKAEKEVISAFQNTLVRLFSMLHAAALAEIEDSAGGEEEDGREAFNFPLIDADGIDESSLLVVKQSGSKVELIFQWIQQLIVENISTGVLSIPPPILSRSFQEIANGMVAFHDAMKISYIPFPFPYAQTCDFLLLLHWIIVPFVVCQWVTEPLWAAVFSFIQVFILWALNFIAEELENPFGQDANDIDGLHMQEEMNEHLMLLMTPSTRKTPTLSARCQDLTLVPFWDQHQRRRSIALFADKSFSKVWHELEHSASYQDHDEVNKQMSITPVARRSTVGISRSRATSSQRTSQPLLNPIPKVSDSDAGKASQRPSTVSSDPLGPIKEIAEEAPNINRPAEPAVVKLAPQGKAVPLEEVLTPEESMPNEPAPLQLQNVLVLDKNISKLHSNGESFTTGSDAFLAEGTFGSGATTATQSIREDTTVSSMFGAREGSLEESHSCSNPLRNPSVESDEQGHVLREQQGMPYNLGQDDMEVRGAQQPRTSPQCALSQQVVRA